MFEGPQWASVAEEGVAGAEFREVAENQLGVMESIGLEPRAII